jgi:hypothetical protein
MEHIHVTRATPLTSRHSQVSHNTVLEGIRLGLIVGVATWLWVAAFDFAAGEPFRTFELLMGTVSFTLIHFVLCIAYGVTIMGFVHASMEEPTVMFAVIFCTILFQGAFVMLTALLSNVGAGDLVWGKFLAGNVMAAILTYVLVNRRHPLVEMFHTAEAHQAD